MQIKQSAIKISDTFELTYPKGTQILMAEQSKINMDMLRVSVLIDEKAESNEIIKFGIYTIEQTVPNGAIYICYSKHPYHGTPRYVFEIGRIGQSKAEKKSERKEKTDKKDGATIEPASSKYEGLKS